MRPTPLRNIAVAKTRDDQSWRYRTLTVLALLVAVLMLAGAAATDWSEGLDMAVGQLAGMAAPLVVMGLLVWAAVALVGRGRS
jgi:hypothetical protein